MRITLTRAHALINTVLHDHDGTDAAESPANGLTKNNTGMVMLESGPSRPGCSNNNRIKTMSIQSLIKFYLGLLITACLLPAIANAENKCMDKRLALTFDDAPTRDTVVMSGVERTQRIVEALQENGDIQAAFFVVTSHIDETSHQRLLKYAEAGHWIANHSHTHPDLHNTDTEEYLQDIKTAHGILSEYPNFQPFFRFPYLHEGADVDQRDLVRDELKQLGYRQGYVTIDNYDFYIATLLREAVKANRSVDHGKVSQLYVEMLLGAANFYHDIACEWLEQVPAHVLLLHENDAAALYLTDLIKALRVDGWEIVSVSDAYRDSIAEITPDTLILGQGRVAALAYVAGANARDLHHEGEDTEFLRQKFEKLLHK